VIGIVRLNGMRFRFDHPHDPSKVGTAGLDRLLPGGYFAEVEQEGRVVSFDGLTTGSGYDPYGHPMEQVLAWLAKQGFYSLDDLREALCLIDDRARIPGRLLLTASIVENLLAATEEAT
jgi:hypothetical protein